MQFQFAIVFYVSENRETSQYDPWRAIVVLLLFQGLTVLYINVIRCQGDQYKHVSLVKTMLVVYVLY